MLKKIILTRSVEDNQILAKQLLALNYSVIEFPAIKIVKHFNLEQKVSLEQYKYLVFTSAKAIPATLDFFQIMGLTIPQQTSIAVVGQASAKVFRECFGFVPNLIANSPNSDSLAKDLLGKLSPREKILFLKGDLALDTLERELGNKGIVVDSLVVYQNHKPEVDSEILEEILAQEPSSLIFPFFSPSAVVNCWEMLGGHSSLLSESKIISIGARTSEKLREFKLSPHFELIRPDNDLLMSAIKLASNPEIVS